MPSGLLALAVAATLALPEAARYRFEEFRVPAEAVTRAAGPALDTPHARRYRTVLRQASSEPPNFAGHYRVVTWGCGTCCTEFAILDLTTGHSWFAPFYNACGYPPGSQESDAGLLYKVDSQLFIAIGARNEKVWGIDYYRWNGRSLELLPADRSRK